MNEIELKDWKKQLLKIITSIEISSQNANRIFDNIYEGEKKMKNHGFFEFYYYQQCFFMSIQLCKLLSQSPNEHYNLRKLFNKIINKNVDDAIQNLIPKDKSAVITLKNLRENIKMFKREIKENEDRIEKISNLRNKLYAHTDFDYKITDLEPSTIADLRILLDLVKRIYNYIFGIFYDEHFMFEYISSWSIDELLRLASKSYSSFFFFNNNITPQS